MHTVKRLAYFCALGVALALTACGSTSPLGITSVQLTVSPKTVLAYSVAVKTSMTSTVSITVTPKDASEQPWTVTGPDQPSLDHRLIIAGMHAASEYDLQITASAGVETATRSSQIKTDPLPTNLPPVKVVTVDTSKMSPGFTLFGVFSWLPSGSPAKQGWLIMLDNTGRIVWYLETSNAPEDVRLMADGNIGYSYRGAVDGFAEVNPLGERQNNWVATGLSGKKAPAGAIPVNIESIHHAVYPLPNGDFLTISSELKTTGSANCPTTSQNMVGDDVVEFDPKDGSVVKKVSEFDILDPCRQRTTAQLKDYNDHFWDQYYGGITTQDWTHTNSVFYDAARGLAIVSVRHQDWIIGMHWTPGGSGSTGKVAWLFGPEGHTGDYGSYAHFTPSGTPFDWQYHQHAPVVMNNGDLLMFDNGNLRPGTSVAPGSTTLPYSRVVEFQIDTTAMTAKQVWQWKAPDPYRSGSDMYCPFIGNVNELPNGDMLADFGGGIEPPSDAIADATERKFARIVELDHQTSDAVVFDVLVSDPATTNFTGYNVYRARRITGFLRPATAPEDAGP